MAKWMAAAPPSSTASSTRAAGAVVDPGAGVVLGLELQRRDRVEWSIEQVGHVTPPTPAVDPPPPVAIVTS